MRITMRMMASQYSKSLNNSLSQLNSASNKATTYRKFDKTSDDPFSASQAYRLRRESAENDTYQSNIGNIEDQLTTAQSAMMSIYDIVSKANTGDTIQAITGTMQQSDRATIATKLRALQQAVLAPANTKFGDKYLFGGSDMNEPAFSIGSDGTSLLYRGIDVNTGKIEAGSTTTINGALIQFGKDSGIPNGYTLQIADSGAAGSTPQASLSGTTITLTLDLSTAKTNQDVGDALKSMTATDNTTGFDFSKLTVTGDLNRPVTAATASDPTYDTLTSDQLKDLSKEQSLVDLGMGLKLNADGSINTQSVFDAAIPGISFLGFGTADGTGTGISNNLYTLLGQIADQLESSDFSMDKIKPYLDNFTKQGDNLMAKITESGTKSNFLSTTKASLETMGTAIIDKDQNVEYVDPADAIMDYQMQQAAYNAALQMGTKIMSKTFLDFMT